MHDDKYEAFGGNHAAFDPVTNLRVGVQVLKECIARAGSLEAGLRFYVGAANLADDGGYAGKVLAEQSHLRQVAGGKACCRQRAADGRAAACRRDAGASRRAEPVGRRQGAEPRRPSRSRCCPTQRGACCADAPAPAPLH